MTFRFTLNIPLCQVKRSIGHCPKWIQFFNSSDYLYKNRVRTFLSSSKFHYFLLLFSWHFKFSMTIGLADTLNISQHFPCLGYFGPNSVMTSSVTNLPNIAFIFHDLPGLENEILKCNDFPSFPWPVRKKRPQKHFEDPEYQVKILLNGYINDFTLKSKNYI